MQFRVFLYHYSIILTFLIIMIPEGGSFDPHDPLSHSMMRRTNDVTNDVHGLHVIYNSYKSSYILHVLQFALKELKKKDE